MKRALLAVLLGAAVVAAVAAYDHGIIRVVHDEPGIGTRVRGDRPAGELSGEEVGGKPLRQLLRGQGILETWARSS